MATFECDNCGEAQTAEEVIASNAVCWKCGDTVIVYTLDAAEEIKGLSDKTDRLTEILCDMGYANLT